MNKWLLLSLILNIIGLAGFIGLLSYFGGLKNLRYRIENRGLSKSYEMRKSHYENLPADSSSTIFIGNSLVEYGDWEERLAEFQVKNRGIAGDGIEGVMDRLPTLSTLNPKNIIVHIGLNDLFFHQPKWLIDRYPVLLAELKSQFSSSKIFIHSLLPVNTDRYNLGTDNNIISAVNRKIEAICKESKVEYINGHDLFINENNQLNPAWTLDGIHLTGPAYVKWADYLRNTLKNRLSE